MFWYVDRRSNNGDSMNATFDCGYHLVKANSKEEAAEKMSAHQETLWVRDKNYWITPAGLIRGPFETPEEVEANYMARHPAIGGMSRFAHLNEWDV